MASACACGTIFFWGDPEALAQEYEAEAEPANGYLTAVGAGWLLADATASETADWERQLTLAAVMSDENQLAISVFLAGGCWVLALTVGGQPGPKAVCIPEDTRVMQQLPLELMAFEQALVDRFPDRVEADELDAVFGAVLEGAIAPDEMLTSVLQMLGCTADWQRWSWYETIPQELFLDPDLTDRVIPLGTARQLWEE